MMMKLKDTLRGGHVHVDVFVGPDADHLAHTGTLVLRLGEWRAVELAFAMAAACSTGLAEKGEWEGCTVVGGNAFSDMVRTIRSHLEFRMRKR